ncbi:MAG: hypothetical protein ACQESF_03040 [Nanobdellota archaeon]
MEVGKKGAFFTLIALVMASILIMVLHTSNMDDMKDKSFVLENRIKSIDYFISDLERDIKRGMYISTYRGLLGIQQQITSKGKYINNLDKSLENIIINGTYNGSYLSVMNNSELSVWFEKIKKESSSMSINIKYHINNIEVDHITPWKISIKMNTSLNISDKQGLAEWNREKNLVANLSIIDFEDPLYNIKTNGKVVNIIKSVNSTDFVTGSNTTNLLKHIADNKYIHTNSSPSYLMRLSGNFSASEHGIESLVDLRELEDLGIDTKEKTCVDYLYFSEKEPTSWHINHTYNWLRIDNQSNHLKEYKVEGLIT